MVVRGGCAVTHVFDGLANEAVLFGLKKNHRIGIAVYHRTRPTVATVSHAPKLPL